MRVALAKTFKVTEVESDGGSFGMKEAYDVLAIGVIDPATPEEPPTDYKKRTRLLVADDEGHLAWVKPEECLISN